MIELYLVLGVFRKEVTSFLRNANLATSFNFAVELHGARETGYQTAGVGKANRLAETGDSVLDSDIEFGRR